MGVYIDPPNQKKEHWLLEVGARLVTVENWSWHRWVPGEIPLCLVRNPQYSALLVAYHTAEMNRAKADDGRPKMYFFAAEQAVRHVLGPAKMQAILDDHRAGHPPGEIAFTT